MTSCPGCIPASHPITDRKTNKGWLTEDEYGLYDYGMEQKTFTTIDSCNKILTTVIFFEWFWDPAVEPKGCLLIRVCISFFYILLLYLYLCCYFQPMWGEFVREIPHRAVKSASVDWNNISSEDAVVQVHFFTISHISISRSLVNLNILNLSVSNVNQESSINWRAGKKPHFVVVLFYLSYSR